MNKLNVVQNNKNKGIFIQLTFSRSAFRLKNILHEWHDVTPKYEYVAGAPQTLHWLTSIFDDFEDLWFIIKFSFDTFLFLV